LADAEYLNTFEDYVYALEADLGRAREENERWAERLVRETELRNGLSARLRLAEGKAIECQCRNSGKKPAFHSVKCPVNIAWRTAPEPAATGEAKE